MAENTKIEWATHTFNPWEGCTKVSAGCKNCYAENRNARFGGGEAVNWGKGAPRRRTSAANWKLPLRWNREAEKSGTRPRVFCASLADVFDDEVPLEWRDELWELIAETPHLDWLLLTKRSGHIGDMIPWADGQTHNSWKADVSMWPNVWLGTSVENQDAADQRIPELLKVPAKVRFLSCEPLLGAVDLNCSSPISNPDGEHTPLTHWLSGRFSRETGALVDNSGISWIIAGGESGSNARPMHPDWARSLRDQCKEAGVPFLFKQWGEWVPRGPESMGYPSVEYVPRRRLTDAGENGQDLAARGDNHVWMQRAGKTRAGRLLDGVEHNEFPEVTR